MRKFYRFEKLYLNMSGVLVCTLLISLFLSFAFELHKARQIFSKYIAVWEEDMSSSYLLHQDNSLALKVVTQLSDLHPSLLMKTLVVGSTQKEISINSCSFTDSQSLTMNGLPIGRVDVCYDALRLLASSVLSPIFMVFLVVLLAMMAIYFYRDWKNRFEQALNSRMAELARQVAHDIRSPLMALQAVTSACQEISSDKKEILLHVSERIQNIANEMLDQSKHIEFSQGIVGRENSSTKLGMTIVSLAVEQVIGEFKERFPHLDFLYQSQLNVNSMITIEKVTFQRMISNILQNAVDASSENTEIVIQAIPRKNEICLNIVDHGHGMTEEQIESIKNKSVSFKKNGNGLGFSFVRNESEKAGGRVLLYSKVHIGTQVQLYLPTVGMLNPADATKVSIS